MNLHSIDPDKVTLRYGGLGRNGYLGFDTFSAFVRGCPLKTAISAHPPSSLLYMLNDPVTSFSAMVALNDTSVDDVCATFKVYADDVLVAVVPSVYKSDGLLEISAEFTPSKKIELVIDTAKCEFCHAIWVDPHVSFDDSNTLWVDSPLGGIGVGVPRTRLHVNKCIALMVNEKCIGMLHDMLGSLFANGNCQDCHVICFGLDLSKSSIKYLESLNVMHVPCALDPTSKSPMFIKTILYAIAQIVVADSYLLLDADMVCLGSLDGLWTGTQLHDSILAVQDAGANHSVSIWDNLMSSEYPYFGNGDVPVRWSCPASRQCTTILNGGVVAGNREAMLGLDSALRRLQPEGHYWCNDRADIPWREQALLNLAASKVGIVELDSVYNTQFLHEKPQVNTRLENMAAWLNGKPVHILHFNGDWGKVQYENDFKGKFALVNGVKFNHYGQSDARLIFEAYAWMKQSSDRWRSTSGRPWRRQFEISLQQLVAISEWTSKNQPTRIVDCGSSAGLMGFAARSGLSTGEPLLYLDIDSEEIIALDQAVYSPPKREWTCDEGELLVLVKGLNFSDVDLVLIDTSRDDRSTAVLLNIVHDTISKTGTVLIADVHNPLCKRLELVARIKAMGFEVVGRSEKIDIIELRLKQK